MSSNPLKSPMKPLLNQVKSPLKSPLNPVKSATKSQLFCGNFRNPHLRSDQAYVKACENPWGKLKHYGKTIGEVFFEWGIP